MQLSAFQLLPPLSQLYWVLKEGIYLARRLGESNRTVDLYLVPDGKQGFYAELVTTADNRLLVLRSFQSDDPLADYL